jgi:hypothetical protein
VIHLLLDLARKVDETANFVFVQFIEQEPGVYDKCHADCPRQDKQIWLGNEFPFSKQYKRASLNCHEGTDAPNVFFS